MPELITKGSVMLNGERCMIMQGGKSYTPVVYSQERSYVNITYYDELNKTGLVVNFSKYELSPSAQGALNQGELSFTIDVKSPNYVLHNCDSRRDRALGRRRASNVVRDGSPKKRWFTPRAMSYALFNQSLNVQSLDSTTFETTPCYVTVPSNTVAQEFIYPDTSIFEDAEEHFTFSNNMSRLLFPGHLRNYYYNKNRYYGTTHFQYYLRVVFYNNAIGRYMPTISGILEYDTYWEA